MTHATPKNLTSRWLDNEQNTLRSYGVALCAAIAFLLLIAMATREGASVQAVELANSATRLIENIQVQMPEALGGKSSAGGSRLPGSVGRPKPVFQLVLPVEPDVPAPDPTDWTQGANERNTSHQSGTGTDTNSNQQTPDASASAASEPDEPFVVFEREPSFSMDALRRAVRYPELAIRTRIEGRVIVKAYINADGTLREAHVATSDNSVLNNAALNGVQQIDYKPAQQNGRAAGCWIYIPVSFELNN